MNFLFRWLEDYSYIGTENRISDFFTIIFSFKKSGESLSCLLMVNNDTFQLKFSVIVMRHSSLT